MTSIYQFIIGGIGGAQINFANFRGKKILAVNVASKCGYTPQYEQLQELSEQFKNKLVIIGFPANNFGAQEPGTNSEIQTFCSVNYNVNFLLTTKISVHGPDIHPIYQWLSQKELNQKMDSEVAWNFQKYLLDEQGQLLAMFPSAVSPMSEELIDMIMK